MTSRLELSGLDWSTTRAFAHPADNQGYLRLNLRGRERDGIVDPGEADGLMEEIEQGLRDFEDLDGGPAVAAVERTAARYRGSAAGRLPDLVVHWSESPATALAGVRSARFGEVRRRGAGSGRSGNHTANDAWALLAPGASRLAGRRIPAAPDRRRGDRGAGAQRGDAGPAGNSPARAAGRSGGAS